MLGAAASLARRGRSRPPADRCHAARSASRPHDCGALAGHARCLRRVADYDYEQLVEAGYSAEAIKLAGFGKVSWTFGGFTWSSTLGLATDEDADGCAATRTPPHAQLPPSADGPSPLAVAPQAVGIVDLARRRRHNAAQEQAERRDSKPRHCGLLAGANVCRVAGTTRRE